MSDFDYTVIEKYYDADYFDTPGEKSMYSKTSDIKRSKWHEMACGWIVSAIPVKGKVLLDAGCGVGLFMDEFQRLGADVYGMDVSDFCAEKVGKRFPDRFFHCRVENMHLIPGDFFDVVHCGDVLEHVSPDKTRAAIDELIRVMKPGGVIYIAIDTTSYEHTGLQDISHINMRSWAAWLSEMDKYYYEWDHEWQMELKLSNEKSFEGFPYENWRYAVMKKNDTYKLE